MQFKYRDFFNTNDDLNIIKEELSILDEGVSTEDALTSNAEAVWDMYKKENNLQKIAEKLKISVEPVKKIIQICLLSTVDEKSAVTINKELGNKISVKTIRKVLFNALGSDYKRDKDYHLLNYVVKIYNLHKEGKSPKEIADILSREKEKENYESVTVDKVNLVLKIIAIAEKQKKDDTSGNNTVDIADITRQIHNQISRQTVFKIITKLNLGEPRYVHKFTEEQDAFILSNYLNKIGPTDSTRLFNLKFETGTRGIPLNIGNSTIISRLKRLINSNKGETGISQKILDLLKKYKNEYFPTVDINNPETKDRLTNYISPERISGRDSLARKGGKVDPTRNMLGQGNLEPGIHQTFTTGEMPVSGQLGKRFGAPTNLQGALPY